MKATEEEIMRFGKIMAILKISLPNTTKLEPDEEMLRTEVFWEALKPFSIDQVEDAARKAVHELRFFPAPADMIRYCTQVAEQKYLEHQSSVPLLEQRRMTHEEAKAALDKLFDRLDYGSMSEADIQADKERVAQRKALLKKQAETLN